MALPQVVAQLVGAVEGLVAVEHEALIARLSMLPHVAAEITWAAEGATTTLTTAKNLIGSSACCVWLRSNISGN